MKKKTIQKRKKRSPASDTKKKTRPVIEPPRPYQRRWGNQFDKKYTDEEIERIGDEMVKYFQDNADAVYYSDFASFKIIARQRLYEFEKKSKYFAFCYQITKDIIISRFTKFGLGGKNAVFPIFGLKNIASDEFKDKHDIGITGGVKIIKDDI